MAQKKQVRDEKVKMYINCHVSTRPYASWQFDEDDSKGGGGGRQGGSVSPPSSSAFVAGRATNSSQ